MVLFGAAATPQEPTFNAQSNVVPVPTLVRDANGNVVYGLRANDFIIEDDGVEQAPYLDEPRRPNQCCSEATIGPDALTTEHGIIGGT